MTDDPSAPPGVPPALELRGITKAFAGVRALDGVSFEVGRGELVGLIGPNGSGKTTAIDCISGFIGPDSGSVFLHGEPFNHPAPYSTAKRGLVRTFQAVRVFGSLSVRGNMLVAGLGRKSRLEEFVDLFRTARWSPELRIRSEEVIRELGLERVADDRADSLSYGQRKLVEFAAVMMQHPSVLLLDEPVAAVNPTMGALIKDLILKLHDTGISILLVEHNIELVTDICQRLVVLDQGKKVADGAPAAVIADPGVQEAYLGR